jgi:hypothetical protein
MALCLKAELHFKASQLLYPNQRDELTEANTAIYKALVLLKEHQITDRKIVQ